MLPRDGGGGEGRRRGREKLLRWVWETFWGDEQAYLNCGNGLTGIYICQNNLFTNGLKLTSIIHTLEFQKKKIH